MRPMKVTGSVACAVPFSARCIPSPLPPDSWGPLPLPPHRYGGFGLGIGPSCGFFLESCFGIAVWDKCFWIAASRYPLRIPFCWDSGEPEHTCHRILAFVGSLLANFQIQVASALFCLLASLRALLCSHCAFCHPGREGRGFIVLRLAVAILFACLFLWLAEGPSTLVTASLPSREGGRQNVGPSHVAMFWRRVDSLVAQGLKNKTTKI